MAAEQQTFAREHWRCQFKGGLKPLPSKYFAAIALGLNPSIPTHGQGRSQRGGGGATAPSGHPCPPPGGWDFCIIYGLRGRPVNTWGRGMVFFRKNCLFQKVTKRNCLSRSTE